MSLHLSLYLAIINLSLSSICPSLCTFIYLSVISTHPSIISVCLSLCIFIMYPSCLCTYRSIISINHQFYLSIYLPFYLSFYHIYLFISPPIYYICLLLNQSYACLSYIYVSTQPSIRPLCMCLSDLFSLCICMYESIHPFITSIWQSSMYLCLPMHACIHPLYPFLS